MATEAIHAIGTALKKGDGGGAGPGAATSAAKTGGNTGNGTMGSVTVSSGAKLGVYELRIITAVTNGGTFKVTDPTGVIIGTGQVASAFSAGGLAFTLADGATDFIVGDGFDITVTALDAEAFTTIAEILGITWSGLQADVKDVTNIHTPWEEVITTIKRSGTITCDVNFVPNNAGQQGLMTEMVNNTLSNYQIVWSDPDNTTWSFSAYVTKFTPTAKVADQLMATVEFKPTGEPSFS